MRSGAVSSFFEGRARLRHSALKDPATVRGLLQLLDMQPGILEAVPNPRTGSLLLRYDPALITPGDLETAAQWFEAGFGPDPADSADSADAADRPVWNAVLGALDNTAALNAAFVLALAGLLPGARRLHRTAGAIFAALALIHALRRR